MPTYLPPRLGIQHSEAVAEAMASAKVGDPILLTLELYREGWIDENGDQAVARVVNDYRPFHATLEDDAPNNPGELVTFQGVPFRYTKPEQTDSGAPSAVGIEIDNVSQQLTALLQQQKTSREPLRLIEREYLPSDNSAPHVLPPTKLVLSDVEATVTSVGAKATFGDLTNRRFPVHTFTRERFPGLTAR
jgi:hypothetical protein